ncbi:uncharacterized protein LOC141907746 [Tubulanus polymorphus]|uniref:uncharacterized protein LOC141907746 n=1 Tax=Tubulanus polymorphus TaxID=672921 RepID=UPI003DA3EA04
MSAEVRKFIESCSTCSNYADRQPEERLYMYDVPCRLWQKVGSDLFIYEDRHYLVTSDYLSGFFELDYLPSTDAKTVIAKIKHHFAWHGIPDTFVSDGGPQYTSSEIKTFGKSWGFSDEFSSPGNSKANGVSEAVVKQAKRLMRLKSSPPQILFGRRTKTQIPTTAELLKPNSASSIEGEIRKKQHMKIETAARLNANRKELKPLQRGDVVRVQPTQHGDRAWQPATVVKRLEERTFKIQTPNGMRLRRNRQQLRLKPHGVREAPSRSGTDPPMGSPGISVANDKIIVDQPLVPSKADDIPPHPSASLPVVTDPQPSSYVTRAGRVVKPPNKLSL